MNYSKALVCFFAVCCQTLSSLTSVDITHSHPEIRSPLSNQQIRKLGYTHDEER